MSVPTPGQTPQPGPTTWREWFHPGDQVDTVNNVTPDAWSWCVGPDLDLNLALDSNMVPESREYDAKEL